MKNVLIILALFSVCWQASARNTIAPHDIQAALNHPAAERLNKNIKLFFGEQRHAKPQQSFGEFTSNKKTNAFNKSDEEACQIAFLSALIALQQRAVNLGANAVVNIKSFYQRKEFVSDSQFECGAGNVVAGTTLKGTVVKLED